MASDSRASPGSPANELLGGRGSAQRHDAGDHAGVAVRLLDPEGADGGCTGAYVDALIGLDMNRALRRRLGDADEDGPGARHVSADRNLHSSLRGDVDR